MQSIDHKGFCVKCGNVGLLGAIGYSNIYLGNLDSKVCVRFLPIILLREKTRKQKF